MFDCMGKSISQHIHQLDLDRVPSGKEVLFDMSDDASGLAWLNLSKGLVCLIERDGSDDISVSLLEGNLEVVLRTSEVTNIVNHTLDDK
jgi:hypothetical protein